MPNFPLFVQSDHSLLRGGSTVRELVTQAKAVGHGALGLCDIQTLSGALEFTREAKAAGILPYVGAQISVSGLVDGQKALVPAWCVGANGWRNLCGLLTSSNKEGGLSAEALRSLPQEGLVFGTGVGFAQTVAERGLKASGYLDRLNQVTKGHLAMQCVSLHGPKALAHMAMLARVHSMPLMPGDPVYYATCAGADTLDAMHCIAQEHRLLAPFRSKPSFLGNAHIPTPQETEERYGAFGRMFDSTLLRPEAAFAIPKGALSPVYPDLAAGETAAQRLQRMATEGLQRFFGETIPSQYDERLKHELGVISTAGFSDYYLVVADIVGFAKSQGIPVGPGRGSGGGSLVAYGCGITRLDPIQHGLLFERFLNPERANQPDFDIDFCERRRGEVLAYVDRKFGRANTAQILALGSFGARGSLIDAGRIMGVSSEEIRKVTSLVPEQAESLKGAYDQTQELRAALSTPTMRAVYPLANRLGGLIRQVGTHAAGVIIAPCAVEAVAPVREINGTRVVDFDKDSVEALGLTKLDLLGLSTVTMAADAEKAIQSTKQDFALSKVPRDDENAFRLISSGHTTGIFQLGSRGMKSALKEVGVSSFEDLMAVISLYRPGPMDQIKTYAAAKRDPAKVRPPHPLLAEVTKDTYGVLIYQEQVMEAARHVAGFSMGEADLLRRSMSRKDMEGMQKMRERFINGAAKKQISPQEAEKVFDVIGKFAGYGFNKSHAVGYAVLAYESSYLKANHPAEFFAAALTAKIGKIDEVAVLLAEARNSGVPILLPDVNRSQAAFSVETQANGHRALRYGLAAVRGVGAPAAEAIVQSRRDGAYTGVQNLMQRVESRYASLRAVTALVKAGSFDSLQPDRLRLVRRLEGDQKLESDQRPPHEWEREMLGQYIREHPLHRFRPAVNGITTHSAGDLGDVSPKDTVRLAGAVTSLDVRKGQGGQNWALATVETLDGPVSAAFFGNAYTKAEPFLKQGALLWMRGSVRQNDHGGADFKCAASLPFDKAVAQLVKHIELDGLPSEAATKLAELARKTPGNCALVLRDSMDSPLKEAISPSLQLFEMLQTYPDARVDVRTAVPPVVEPPGVQTADLSIS